MYLGTQSPSTFQTFKELVLSGEINLKLQNVLLAPIVDAGDVGIVYDVGLVLAKYTSGNYKGCYVNYQPAGSNGSNIPVAILYDNFVSRNTTGTVFYDGTKLVPVGNNGLQSKVQIIVDGSAGADLKAQIGTTGSGAVNYIYWTLPTGQDDLTTIFGTYGNFKLNGTLRCDGNPETQLTLLSLK
jgi:hypothetical protein